MPVIAKVGRRAPRVKLMILGLYLVLIIGSITTVYPFWLMVAGSLASNHTAQEFRLVPRYLYNERALFEAGIWLKYYRYGGLSDVMMQWKVNVPGSYSGENRWQMVPGTLPEPGGPVARVLANRFCAVPYERFREGYESIGSPTTWTPAFEKLVAEVYPFGVDAVRSLVEAHPPFAFKRHELLRVLKRAFNKRLKAFLDDYRKVGLADSQSVAFKETVARYPFLSQEPAFLELMREYSLSRKPDLSDEKVLRRIEDFYAFRETLPVSHRDAFWIGGHRTFPGDILYREWLREKYGSLEALNKAYGTDTDTWVRVFAPPDYLTRRNMYIGAAPMTHDWNEWKLTLPAKYVRAPAMEYWWSMFLRKAYGRDIRKLNEAWGSEYVRFFDVPLARTVPGEGAARRDWETFVRRHLPPRFVRFNGGVDAWRAFVVKKLGSLERANRSLKRSWQSADDIELPYYEVPVTFDPQDRLRFLAYPPTKRENDLLLEFLATDALPLENIRVVTAENLYRDWMLAKYGTLDAVNDAYGTHEKSIGGFYYPMPMTDWKEVVDSKGEVRSFTFTRAYRTAIDHLVRYRRSLWNTAVYCTAVVLAALIVNPLCAYALSRFNLPGSYKVLLFLLATMAFPAEVTMIPNFLILKSFPLMRIVFTVVGFLVGGLLAMSFTSSKRLLYPLIGAIVGAILGCTVVTEAATHVAGITGKVSLLNTYWALILPGVASGYSVFILKGFFDSLPQEIYESATIDGAGEIRIFAQITLPMSKPVLAVIALWSFTAAYGSFTWALIICQDPKMWTLMVNLYQYQMLVDPSERLSALTLASLPTLVVFLITQRVILKGIILPTYK